MEGASFDGRGLRLAYDGEESKRNTLHFALHALVSDHA